MVSTKLRLVFRLGCSNIQHYSPVADGMVLYSCAGGTSCQRAVGMNSRQSSSAVACTVELSGDNESRIAPPTWRAKPVLSATPLGQSSRTEIRATDTDTQRHGDTRDIGTEECWQTP